MKLIQRTAMGIGALALAALFSILVAPKAAHALSTAATLVRDVDNGARDPFQAIFNTNCTGEPGTFACTGFTVPTTNGAGDTVSMLVIQEVGGWCPNATYAASVFLTNYPDSQLNNILSSSGLQTASSTSGYFAANIVSSNIAAGFSQPTKFYAAPGSQIAAILTDNTSACAINISGYFIKP
jgi:hypothetical protein